jgi:hypothetical protein
VAVYARLLRVDEATGAIAFQFVRGMSLLPDRDVPRDIGMWRWRPQDPHTFRLTEGPYFKTGEAFENAPARDACDPSIMTATVPLPNHRKLLGELAAYRRGANLFLINDANFANKEVGIWHCQNVTFDGISFYASLGMVFLSSDLDHLRINGCRIGLPPGLTVADRPLAAASDGYHFHETQGFILFENNEIALTDDDPISMKDGVWRDVRATGKTTLRTGPGFAAGDTIQLYRCDFSPLAVMKVAASENGLTTVDRPLPADLPEKFLAQNTREHTDNWIIRNNDLHDYYGRLMLYTPHGIVEGNSVENSYVHIGASCAGFDNAGIASDIVVRDNLFLDTTADTSIWGADSRQPVFKNVVFVNNSFIRQPLRLNNTGEALIVENYFESMPEKDKAATAIEYFRSQDATIEDNWQAGAPEFGLNPGKSTMKAGSDNHAIP